MVFINNGNYVNHVGGVLIHVRDVALISDGGYCIIYRDIITLFNMFTENDNFIAPLHVSLERTKSLVQKS